MLEKEKTIGFKARQLSNAVKRNGEQQDRQFENRNITMLQRWIIGHLAHNQDRDIFQKELEQVFAIGKSTLTETLHVMEKNGLVVRMPCEEDARCKKIVLTEVAKSIHEEVELGITAFEEKLRKNITDEELEQFFSIVNRMLENARSE